jgi:hypothetical protein
MPIARPVRSDADVSRLQAVCHGSFAFADFVLELDSDRPEDGSED